MADEKEEFHFIREKIKDKPIDKKKVIRRVAGVLVLGVIFGIGACFSFFIAKPHVEKIVGKKPEPDPLVIVEDETQTESNTNEGTESESVAPETVVETTIIREEVEIEELKKLTNEMAQSAKVTMNTMVVSVSSIAKGIDWFDAEYENAKETNAGLIVAENAGLVYIVTEYRGLSHADKIVITFSNQENAEGKLVNYDGTTSLAVVSVPMESLSDTVKGLISMESMQHTATATVGDSVFALGMVQGNVLGISQGMITATGSSFAIDSATGGNSSFDVDYNLVHTDIIGNENSSGILVDLDGKIIGIITEKYSMNKDKGVVTAMTITQLKKLIERLSNGISTPYLGIRGAEISEETAKEKNVPVGLYVSRIADDSPAAQAGICPGDIIISMGDSEIKTYYDFKRALESLEIGQDIQVIVMKNGAEEYIELPPYVFEVGVLTY